MENRIDLKKDLVANEALNNVIYFSSNVNWCAKQFKRDKVVEKFWINVLEARWKDAQANLEKLKEQFEIENEERC